MYVCMYVRMYVHQTYVRLSVSMRLGSVLVFRLSVCSVRKLWLISVLLLAV